MAIIVSGKGFRSEQEKPLGVALEKTCAGKRPRKGPRTGGQVSEGQVVFPTPDPPFCRGRMVAWRTDFLYNSASSYSNENSNTPASPRASGGLLVPLEVSE